jgi:hypothetical protein
VAAKPPRLPSDRSFGLVLAGAFAAIVAQGLLRGHGLRGWAGAAAASVLALALLRPRLLRPMNRAWMALGRALGRVVSPVALGIVFYGVVTPLGLLARFRRRDPLGRRFPTDAESHWQKREPLATESLERPY